MTVLETISNPNQVDDLDLFNLQQVRFVALGYMTSHRINVPTDIASYLAQNTMGGSRNRQAADGMTLRPGSDSEIKNLKTGEGGVLRARASLALWSEIITISKRRSEINDLKTGSGIKDPNTGFWVSSGG